MFAFRFVGFDRPGDVSAARDEEKNEATHVLALCNRRAHETRAKSCVIPGRRAPSDEPSGPDCVMVIGVAVVR